VLKILESFGLARTDAGVYVFLAKKGPLNGEDIADAMNLSKNQLRQILKSLQDKGVVNAERSALFSALAFEKVLDMVISMKDEEAQVLKETKEELLSSWRAITQDKKQKDA
jgi:sugar-specific transcriptional regulator TrmB